MTCVRFRILSAESVELVFIRHQYITYHFTYHVRIIILYNFIPMPE